MGKDDVEQLLEVIPEELTNEDSLGVEQEQIGEEKETAGEEMHITAPEDLPMGQDVEVEDSDIDDPDLVWVQANMLFVFEYFTKRFKKYKKLKIRNR